MTKHELKLNGYSFQELFAPEGLKRLDDHFLSYLYNADQLLHDQLCSFRSGVELAPKELSQLIISCAPILEAFMAELFDIEEQVGQKQASLLSQNPIFIFKKHFIHREAKRALKKADEFADFATLDAWLRQQLKEAAIDEADLELSVARWAAGLLQEPDLHVGEIERLVHWCVKAITTPEGQKAVAAWVSFHAPARLNYANLVTTAPVADDPIGRLEGPQEHFRQRDGFALTDERMNQREVLDEIHYCVYCHKNDGDFCSKGFPVKKTAPELGLKINPLGDSLTGCPLEEKISEMHWLKKAGYSIAALAAVMIDNPMCPATGHRICNDCMKACIYQKQEPVNIPQVETHVLTDVLSLPWGVEIYDLLTRWNPLRPTQWVAKPYNSKKILIMGMGPAGFTLAHHLLMEGFAVVGMEGLKIEPLNPALVHEPIFDYDSLKESLDDRVMAGFGGVAEYGITVRWDKNFLKLIYISLSRRPYFQVYGGVRFGGTLKVDDAWTYGFDHLAIAVGAGLPRELAIPNSLAPGMRQANDFLMALQLTGAAKSSSLANLQVRLPAVVIGGGLTGIDTATEVQAYYIKQVEKVLYRYQTLVEYFGEEKVRQQFKPAALEILEEFIAHGLLVKAERDAAAKENRQADFLSLLRQWGGVTVAYRRTMQESPAYRRNHEEVIKALEEGIYYAEGLEPKAVQLDHHGYVAALRCQWRVQDEEGNWMQTDEEQTLAAKSIFVATGAKPNIAYEFEHRGTFLRDGFNYKRYEDKAGQLVEVDQMGHCKVPEFGAFTSYERDHHRVTFLGDTHPVFHGSVVKAIASAKRIYPSVVKSLEGKVSIGSQKEYQSFKQQMETLFTAKVVSVKRHTEDMVELTVRAPMAARNFCPGQFYRLQNYEMVAKKCGQHSAEKTRLQTEALAMIGIRHPQMLDQLSFTVIERGASSRLVATFQPGDPISIMGPTGVRSKIPQEPETVMIIGGSMAAAHLRSLGPALKEAGHQVFFVACMQSGQERYCKAELEAAADVILWLSESGGMIKPGREQDRAVSGELITALRNYCLGQLNGEHVPPVIPLDKVNRVMVVGAPNLIRRVQRARSGLLKEFIHPDTQFSASVYGSMQCMLKGVCAQCLQWQIDPATGKRTKAVYACSWQEQPMQMIDIENIDERLSQNATQETLSGLWLDYLFEKYGIIRV